jgi:hypothetical protein
MPGDTELTRILGPAMEAKPLTRWICAALVTEYAFSNQHFPHEITLTFTNKEKHTKELPLGLTPAKLAVVINAPSLSSR